MSKKHKHTDKMDQKDPMLDPDMEENRKQADKSESHMDGPNIMDPGEDTNKSQDEGKVYDL